MKTCASCKWCDFNHKYPGYSECISPENKRIDPVTGEYLTEVTYCSNARIFPLFCGPDGKWWEPKYEEGLSECPKEVPKKCTLIEKLIAWIKRS